MPGQENEVVAYRDTTGEIAWRLPADGVHFCGMSSTASARVGVLLFGGPHPDIPGDMLCNQVRAAELATGRSRWSVETEAPRPLAKGTQAGRHRPEISGDVVVADTGGYLIGLPGHGRAALSLQRDGEQPDRPKPATRSVRFRQ
jgi:hypothetical protein